MATGNSPRGEGERDIETGRSENSLCGQAEGNCGIWFAESVLVVAILMATVAFQARLNPPGGVWQDTGYHKLTSGSGYGYHELTSGSGYHSLTSASPPGQTNHTAGQSVLWVQHVVRYRLFAISNDITLALSLLAIQLLLARHFVKPITSFLLALAVISTAVALVSMAFTYVASSVSISSDKVQTISLSVVLIFSVTPSVTFCVFKVKSLKNYCTGTSN